MLHYLLTDYPDTPAPTVSLARFPSSGYTFATPLSIKYILLMHTIGLLVSGLFLELL